jgi:hypothetical protein
MRRREGFVLGAAWMLAAVLGCGDDSTTRVCAPGATQICYCTGGVESAQSCAADGSRWTACDCGGADGDADADGDTTCTPTEERCGDGIDNDCDGLTDEQDAAGCRLYHPDADGDLYGATASGRCLCAPEAPYVVTDGSDCDDTNAAVHPGVPEDCTNDLDDDCSGRQECARLPVAPSASEFMWQDVQTAFTDPEGGRCTGHLALALGNNATCYADAADNLRCAGRIHTRAFGTSFVDATTAQVEQVMISGFDSAFCVLQSSGRLACMGAGNAHGQFGIGSTGATTVFRDYVVGAALARFGAGTWDSVCAITTGGVVYCAGYGYAATPAMQDAGHVHTSFYSDSTGALHLDPTDVWRVQSGYPDCTVQATGLVCNGNPIPGATPGHVVTGGVRRRGMGYRYCWLHDDGQAFCGDSPSVYDPPASTVAAFGARPVLFLALNQYVEGECAVYDDGSLACRGGNADGMFGAGTTAIIASETVVAPPGSFDLRCL